LGLESLGFGGSWEGVEGSKALPDVRRGSVTTLIGYQERNPGTKKKNTALRSISKSRPNT